MTIEPIGSVMSVQAQASVQTKPAAQTERSTGESTSSATVQEAVKIDKTLNVVQDSQQKGASTEQGQEQPNNEQIKKAVEQLSKNLVNSEAVFGIHEGTNRVTIKIVDKDTKEVIKEVPPEKTLDMIAKVWEIAGILVDERR